MRCKFTQSIDGFVRSYRDLSGIFGYQAFSPTSARRHAPVSGEEVEMDGIVAFFEEWPRPTDFPLGQTMCARQVVRHGYGESGTK